MSESPSLATRPSWLYHDEFRRPRFNNDPRCNRTIVSRLQQVLRFTSGPHKHQWGFVIARTAYGPGTDEQFCHALSLIAQVARIYADYDAEEIKARIVRAKEYGFGLDHIPEQVDTRPNDEMVRRYANTVLEDKQALDGASIAEVRDFFNGWVKASQGTCSAGDMRYASCLVLDAETLAQLAVAPEDFPLHVGSRERRESPYWVKVVDAQSEPADAFLVRLFGQWDLVRYFWDRNYGRRAVVELIYGEEESGIYYFGTAPVRGKLGEM